MRKMTQMISAKLLGMGIVAGVEWVMPEDNEPGGYIVRVFAIHHIEPAEQLAAELTRDYGFEVLVAF